MLARAFAWGLAIPIAVLPLSIQNLLGSLLGELLWLLLPYRRRVVLANLAVAFPALDEAARRVLARRHFRHLGRFALDTLQQPAFAIAAWRQRRFRRVGWENLDRALAAAAGKGVVYMCAHLGSWEICAAVGGHPGVRLISVYKGTGRFLDRVLLAMRQGLPQHLVEKHESGRALVEAAREGGFLGLIADQGGHSKYPFFGRPAYFPDGPGHFVARYGLPVVMAFGIRGDDGVYDVHCLPLPVEDLAGRPREEVQDAVNRRYLAVLEEWVARYPEQYYWVHDVWRTFKDD